MNLFWKNCIFKNFTEQTTNKETPNLNKQDKSSKLRKNCHFEAQVAPQ